MSQICHYLCPELMVFFLMYPLFAGIIFITYDEVMDTTGDRYDVGLKMCLQKADALYNCILCHNYFYLKLNGRCDNFTKPEEAIPVIPVPVICRRGRPCLLHN